MSLAYYTEKEALTKRCPFRVSSTGASSPCCASACMKWGWHHKQVDNGAPKGCIAPPKYERTDKGYCGA